MFVGIGLIEEEEEEEKKWKSELSAVSETRCEIFGGRDGVEKRERERERGKQDDVGRKKLTLESKETRERVKRDIIIRIHIKVNVKEKKNREK